MQPVTAPEALADCDLVIEAVVEELGAKQALFRRLGQLCPAETLLASNTSSLSVTQIAAGVAQPQRVVGMHFFNPAPILPLVEVVRGALSAEAALERAMAAARAFGKQPSMASGTGRRVPARIAIAAGCIPSGGAPCPTRP